MFATLPGAVLLLLRPVTPAGGTRFAVGKAGFLSSASLEASLYDMKNDNTHVSTRVARQRNGQTKRRTPARQRERSTSRVRKTCKRVRVCACSGMKENVTNPVTGFSKLLVNNGCQSKQVRVQRQWHGVHKQGDVHDIERKRFHGYTLSTLLLRQAGTGRRKRAEHGVVREHFPSGARKGMFVKERREVATRHVIRLSG